MYVAPSLLTSLFLAHYNNANDADKVGIAAAHARYLAGDLTQDNVQEALDETGANVDVFLDSVTDKPALAPFLCLCRGETGAAYYIADIGLAVAARRHVSSATLRRAYIRAVRADSDQIWGMV